MNLEQAVTVAAINGKFLSVELQTSSGYKQWISVEDLRRCIVCAKNHGKVWPKHEKIIPSPPVHENCRCVIEPMQAILAGTATINRINGADWTLKTEAILPEYYIGRCDAIKAGWTHGKFLSDFLPGKMLTAGIYKNYDGRLPQKEGRIWYEADINYLLGKRNSQRILWSSDGLIFVTYDHYNTFYEIV